MCWLRQGLHAQYPGKPRRLHDCVLLHVTYTVSLNMHIGDSHAREEYQCVEALHTSSEELRKALRNQWKSEEN